MNQKSEWKPSFPCYSLTLADGTCWTIKPADNRSAQTVAVFAQAMRLGCLEGYGFGRTLIVTTEGNDINDILDPSVLVCHLRDNSLIHHSVYADFLNISSTIVGGIQDHGGVLLHGALAVRDGKGIILAAPGGTGKTTASQRLPNPWRSLSDDAALVVRTVDGLYRAHPWPTWSRFMNKGTGYSWDVQESFPLVGIFFLVQADSERIQQIGKGEGAIMLLESTRQVVRFSGGSGYKDIQRHHMVIFQNVCDLVSNIPVHTLYLSLQGRFWEYLEEWV